MGSQYHATSSINENDVGRVGRLYVVHSNLALAFVPVSTNAVRLCAVATNTENSKILAVSVYMSNEDNSDD